MGVSVTFDYGNWVATYPEFSQVTKEQAANFFTIATTVHANDGSGPVQTADLQTSFLNMLVSHIAAQYATPKGTPAPSNTLVGRLSDVSEGSVSASAEYATEPVSATQAWFTQTKYGALYWAATAQYRTMRYRVPCGSSQIPLPWIYPNNTNGFN